MTRNGVTVKVPATTANLGPGFDCLGLALDLWNTSRFTLIGEEIRVMVTGEGVTSLPTGARNLMVKAFFDVYRRQGQPLPPGLLIESENNIPLGSGLGSSAAAVLAGVMAANGLLGEPFTSHDILRIANELEGHADNAAAALYGGLVATFTDSSGDLKVHKLDCAFKKVVVVQPEIKLPTIKARQALPKLIPMKDAVFNLGHSIIMIEALRSGNRDLLNQAMEDHLHQPYRLGLIPGAQAALMAARNLGAPAALSGAGPSVVAFAHTNPDAVIAAMQSAFNNAGVKSRAWRLNTTYTGIRWEIS